MTHLKSIYKKNTEKTQEVLPTTNTLLQAVFFQSAAVTSWDVNQSWRSAYRRGCLRYRDIEVPKHRDDISTISIAFE